MDFELTACFDKWEASFNALCRYLEDASTPVPASNPAAAPTSPMATVGVIPVLTSVPTGDGILDGEPKGAASPANISKTTLRVVPSASDGFITMALALCSTECSSRNASTPVTANVAEVLVPTGCNPGQDTSFPVRPVVLCDSSSPTNTGTTDSALRSTHEDAQEMLEPVSEQSNKSPDAVTSRPPRRPPELEAAWDQKCVSAPLSRPWPSFACDIGLFQFVQYLIHQLVGADFSSQEDSVITVRGSIYQEAAYVFSGWVDTCLITAGYKSNCLLHQAVVVSGLHPGCLDFNSKWHGKSKLALLVLVHWPLGVACNRNSETFSIKEGIKDTRKIMEHNLAQPSTTKGTMGSVLVFYYLAPSFCPVAVLGLQLAESGNSCVCLQELQLDRNGIEVATFNGVITNINPCQLKWFESILASPVDMSPYCTSFSIASEGTFCESKLEFYSLVSYRVVQNIPSFYGIKTGLYSFNVSSSRTMMQDNGVPTGKHSGILLQCTKAKWNPGGSIWCWWFSACYDHKLFQGGRYAIAVSTFFEQVSGGHQYYLGVDEVRASASCYLGTFFEWAPNEHDYYFYLNQAYYFDKGCNDIISYRDDYHGDSSKTKEVLMPWDPGKSVLRYHPMLRLGDKPNFKEGGMLGTYLYSNNTHA